MGGVRCAITDPVITFAPGLRNRFHIEGTQTGRGPSTADFTAGLSGCTDPSTGPAVAGIDHGTLHGTGKVPGSNCEKLSNLKLNTTITWMTAAGTVVGETKVKLGLAITVHDFDSPRTVDFAGTAKPPSHVFPRDPVSFSLMTDSDELRHFGRLLQVLARQPRLPERDPGRRPTDLVPGQHGGEERECGVLRHALEVDLDPHADPNVLGSDVDEVRHDARPFGEIDERDDERQQVPQ